MDKKRILIVDDEKAIRYMLTRFFQRSGFHIKTEATSEEGVKSYNQEKFDFDIVITDVNMPGEGGIELIRKIKLWKPSQKIIVISGNPDSLKKARRCDQKPDLILEKPFSLGDLMEAVNSLLL
jgi:DNA-binding response OmpR family regulator